MRLDDVKGGDDWSALEKILIDCAHSGKQAELPGNGERPEESTNADLRVRAELIRFLLLGGDCEHRTHAKGVRLCGAWIEGKIDFRNEKTRLNLILKNCLMLDEVDFEGASCLTLAPMGQFRLIAERRVSGSS